MLDGQTSLDEIKDRFEERVPAAENHRRRAGQVRRHAARSGLVIADAPGQGASCKKRRDERKRQEMLSALANVLAIRFKGIDPDRLLTWLVPSVRWIYSPPAVTVCMLLALSALTLVMVQFDEFQSQAARRSTSSSPPTTGSTSASRWA